MVYINYNMIEFSFQILCFQKKGVILQAKF